MNLTNGVKMKIKNILSLLLLTNITVAPYIFTMQEATKEQMAEETAIENIEKQKRYEFFKSHPEIFNIAKGIHGFEKNAGDELPDEIRMMIGKYYISAMEAIKTENGQALFAAIRNHNIKKAMELVKKPFIYTNIQDEYGDTALIVATRNAHKEIIQPLLQKGANPNLQGNDRWTALHDAVNRNKIDMVEMLLQNHANPNLQNNRGWTALHLAVNQNKIDVVKVLLQNYANPNLQDNDGWAALHLAVNQNKIDIAEMLFQKGANPNLQNRIGDTALDLALRFNRTEIVQILLATLETQNQSTYDTL